MSLGAWAPPLIAAGLAACGALVLLQVLPERRRRLAARVALVAPAEPERRTAQTLDHAFLNARAAAGHEAELVTVGRLCRRLGLHPRHAPNVLAAVRGLCGLAFAGITFAVLQGMGAGRADNLSLHLMFSLIASLAGWFAPALWLRQVTAARKRAVSRGLPDALELLVVCVEAGLALEDALDRVTLELRASQPLLADELAMTAADLKVLPDRNQAFVKLAQRVGTPAIRSVVTTLSQTLRYGTPLAAALRVAAAELRSDAILALEERAGSLPALMTVPLMVFVLPTIFLIVGGPAILRLIDLFAHGR